MANMGFMPLVLVLLVWVGIEVRGDESEYDQYYYEPAPLRRQNRTNGVLGSPDYSFCSFVDNHEPDSTKPVNPKSNDTYDGLKTPGLIRANGFKVKPHPITTADGYKLTLYRIVKPESQLTGMEIGQPILLHHGFSGSSADYLMNDPEYCLPFYLAKSGYDVWLANARGTEYSNEHVSLKQSDPKYWEFSWHEIGKYDVKAEIEYIVEKTKWKKIAYVGHSMGTTVFYVSMMENPDLKNKVSSLIAMAPATGLSTTRTPFRVATFLTFIADFLPISGPLLPKPLLEAFRKTFPQVCTKQVSVYNFCENLVSFLIGANSENFKGTTYRRVLQHLPTTTSSRVLLHYLQNIRDGKFQQFDFGYWKNLDKYGSPKPPEYNLSLVDVKSFNLYGKYDLLVVNKDVENILNSTANTSDQFNVQIIPYNHLDFIWGQDSAGCVNSQINDFLALNLNCEESPDPATCYNRSRIFEPVYN